MHVYLTGFMGAGKTSVGRALAGQLGWSFVDLDELVERHANMTVSEIFERLGEPEFRRMETTALSQITESEAMVVATGGGTMIEPRNRRLLSERGVTVWLDVPFSIAMKRLDGGESGDRPLLRDPEDAVKLYEDRFPVYQTSDLRIEIGRETSVQEVAESVRLILETKQCDI